MLNNSLKSWHFRNRQRIDDSVPKVSCGEVVLEVRPYLQPNLSEGTELQCRLLPRGELSIVNKIYLYITP